MHAELPHHPNPTQTAPNRPKPPQTTPNHPTTPNPQANQYFSMYLSNDPDDTKHPSHLLFGSYDLSIVGSNATWQYTPVIKRGYGDFKYWTVKMSALEVMESSSSSKVKYDLCKSTCYAIVDSGTSGIAVPEDSYDALIELVTEGLHCKVTIHARREMLH